MTPPLSHKTAFRSSTSKSIAIAAVIALWVCGARAKETAWIELVHDGRISDRWETKGNWHVDPDGVVMLTPRPGETGWKRFDAYLWSKDKYSDFEIEFDYRVSPKGNSGFYLHVGDKADPVKRGIEVQIADSFGKPKQSKLTDHESGGVIPGIPPTKNVAKPTGDWNQMQIVVKGGVLRVTLNGELVNEIKLDHPNIKDRPVDGYIGFQDHGLPLAVRAVRIRRL